MPKFKDLTGQRFGKLTVIERDYSKIGTFWICKCDCGNYKTVRADSLTTGRTTSCDCYRKEQARKANAKKLAGQWFNNIEVLEDLNESTSDNRALHLCRCGYCGNLFKVRTVDLTAQLIESCGCLKSKGEQKLINIFIQNNIKFIKEYTFNDLYLKTDIYKQHPLRFDFYLPDYNVLIEYQGIQHYKTYSNYYSDRMIQNDKIKKNYCKAHNLKLIEITYKDFNNLSYEYIKNLLNKE